MSHGHTYVHPKTTDPDTFKMQPFPYYISREVFHNEFLSWPGVQCMKIQGTIFYSLDAMHPFDPSIDASSSSKKRIIDPMHDFQLMTKKLQECVSFIHNTISEVSSMVSSIISTSQIPIVVSLIGKPFKPPTVPFVFMSLVSVAPPAIFDIVLSTFNAFSFA